MEREATSGYHLLNSPLVRSVQIPSGKCRIKSADHTGGRNSIFWKMSVDYETEIGRRVCS